MLALLASRPDTIALLDETRDLSGW